MMLYRKNKIKVKKIEFDPEADYIIVSEEASKDFINSLHDMVEKWRKDKRKGKPITCVCSADIEFIKKITVTSDNE